MREGFGATAKQEKSQFDVLVCRAPWRIPKLPLGSPHLLVRTKLTDFFFFLPLEYFSSITRSGFLVPSSGKRLRAEFVYRAVIQCADEIRRRGKEHVCNDNSSWTCSNNASLVFVQPQSLAASFFVPLLTNNLLFSSLSFSLQRTRPSQHLFESCTQEGHLGHDLSHDRSRSLWSVHD